MNIKERDLEVIIDQCKASLSIAGMSKFGANYGSEQVRESLERILNAMGSREIELSK